MELIHTCYRVTDPERSIAFCEALGLERRRELPIRDEAMNYFPGVPGRGHVALTVDDLDGTLKELAGQVIEPEPPPYQVREGGSRLCFVRDPDG